MSYKRATRGQQDYNVRQTQEWRWNRKRCSIFKHSPSDWPGVVVIASEVDIWCAYRSKSKQTWECKVSQLANQCALNAKLQDIWWERGRSLCSRSSVKVADGNLFDGSPSITQKGCYKLLAVYRILHSSTLPYPSSFLWVHHVRSDVCQMRVSCTRLQPQWNCLHLYLHLQPSFISFFTSRSRLQPTRPASGQWANWPSRLKRGRIEDVSLYRKLAHFKQMSADRALFQRVPKVSGGCLVNLQHAPTASTLEHISLMPSLGNPTRTFGYHTAFCTSCIRAEMGEPLLLGEPQ